MSLQKKVSKAAFWQLLNVSCQAILQITYIALMARLVSRESHGVFALINILNILVAMFSEGGVGSAIIQRKEVNRYHVSAAFYLSFLTSLIFYSIFHFSAGSIAAFYDGKFDPVVIKVSALAFVFQCIGSVSRSLLVRDLRFKHMFLSANIGFLIGNIIVGTFLASLKWELWAMVFAVITTELVTASMYFFFARHSLKITYAKKEFLEIINFGYRFIFVRIFNYGYAQIDKMLIGKFFPVLSLAYYEKSDFIAKLPTKYIGITIDSLLFSTISKIQDNEEKARTTYLTLLSLLLSICIYLSTVVFNLSYPLVQLFLGPKWGDVSPFLQIFSCNIALLIVARLGDILVRSFNKMGYSFPIKVLFFFVLIAVILSFKHLPLLQLTMLVVGVQGLYSLAMIALSNKILKLKWINWLRATIPALKIMAIFVLKYWAIGTALGAAGIGGVLSIILQIALDLPIWAMIFFYSSKILGENESKFLAILLKNLPVVKNLKIINRNLPTIE